MPERKDPQYEANVLAHIEMHKSKGETVALEAHMESPVHRAIVEAAADVKVLTEPESDPDADGPDGPDGPGGPDEDA